MLDSILEALLDTVKLFPYLWITFLLLEFMEHKLGKKSGEVLKKNQKYGPILGGILGGFPQCGFGSMAANLFSARVISKGTLIAVFLATSDEMIPVMLSEGADPMLILKIIGFKVAVGIMIGFIVDIFFQRKEEKKEHIHELCEHDHCSCHHDGIFLSSVKHAFKIGVFILTVNIILNIVLFYVGEENLSHLLENQNAIVYFLSSLVGFIPNCAGSVVITELYLAEVISTGTMLAGLLTGSGVGILLLFRANKNIKENLGILGILYFTGIIIGFLVDIIL